MLKRLLSTTILFIGITIGARAQSYMRTDLGIKSIIDSLDVEIQFYDPSIVRVIKHPEDEELSIGDRKGSFPGMFKECTFNIVRVSPNKAGGMEAVEVYDQVVTYDGKQVEVTLAGNRQQ